MVRCRGGGGNGGNGGSDISHINHITYRMCAPRYSLTVASSTAVRITLTSLEDTDNDVPDPDPGTDPDSVPDPTVVVASPLSDASPRPFLCTSPCPGADTKGLRVVRRL